ncbi:MAG: CYTH domain-containing protein [Limisphaerales bacterium]
MEIERKFLVKNCPAGWKRLSGSKIRQGYFPVCGKGLEIRLRQKGSQYFITFKEGLGKVRREEEIRISEEHFRKLWPLVRAVSVTKTRYRVAHSGRTIELDVYSGEHQGLKVAEVEFPSRRKCNAFKPPAWLGREITGNRRYANESLARSRHG